MSGERKMGMNEGHEDGGPARLQALDIADVTSPLAQAVLQETRLRIIAVLASPEAVRRGGYTLQELGQMLGCSPQNAHHHLKILDRAEAVRVVRTEATQRIPRQFWVSDLRLIRLRPIEGSILELDLGLPDATLRRLSDALKPWSEANGGAEAHRVVLQFAAFVASLDEEKAAELIGILDGARRT